MIHKDGVLILPGLLANVGHEVVIDVLSVKSPVFYNEFPRISICVIYHHYVIPCIHPSLFIGYIQDFIVEEVYPFGLTSKPFRYFSVV